MTGLLKAILATLGFAGPAHNIDSQWNKIAVGQVWSFHGAYPEAELLIAQFEELDDLHIVHIQVTGVRVPADLKSRLGGRDFTNLNHAPISRNHLLDSLNQLIDEDQKIPDSFFGGYQAYLDMRGDQQPINLQSVEMILETAFETLRTGTVVND